MNLLIVSATDFEVADFENWIRGRADAGQLGIVSRRYEIGGDVIEFLITGIGIHAVTYHLTKVLCNAKYDFVLQAGVGGAFDDSIALGEIFMVTTDRFGDLGAEDHDTFIDIFNMGLLENYSFPYENRTLIMPESEHSLKIILPKADAITVNTVSGSETTIERRKSAFGVQLESMEGAAFHFVCLMQGVPFAQIRAVSNHLIPRDKSKWKMKEAITNLNNWLIKYIQEL